MPSPRLLLAALALAPALLLPRVAAAQQAEDPERRWYGWQNLIGLGASAGVLTTGVLVNEEWLGAVGFAGYALSGPIIHAAHENYVSAGVSLGLNLGLPLATGLAGAGILCSSSNNCRGTMSALGVLGGFLIGASAGVLIASVVDVAALSWEDVPVPAGATGSALRARPAWVMPPLTIGGRF